MKHLYLFNEGSRAAIYGIGTYIRHMIALFSGRQDIKLNVVVLNSDKDEFEVEEKDGYRSFCFPRVSLPSDKLEIYIRNSWYVLYSYIEEVGEEDRLLFHFNYGQELPLLKLAKQYFPECTTLFTIHYQMWCFELDGNTTLFRKIMQDRREGKTQERFKNIADSIGKELAVYSEADSIVCLSRYTYELLLEEYGVDAKKISLAYNGLPDECPAYEEKEVRRIKRDLCFEESGKLVLFVGRLDDIKGVGLLVDAGRGRRQLHFLSGKGKRHLEPYYFYRAFDEGRTIPLVPDCRCRGDAVQARAMQLCRHRDDDVRHPVGEFDKYRTWGNGKRPL